MAFFLLFLFLLFIVSILYSNRLYQKRFMPPKGQQMATNWWGYGWRPWWTDKPNPEFQTYS
jgi:hypothetical protein